MDRYGVYRIEMPEHHVHVDERNFFSRYMQGEREKQEKEAILEAFCKIKDEFL